MSTTIDSTMIAEMIEMFVAAAHDSSITVNSTSSTAPQPMSRPGTLMRPVPSLGQAVGDVAAQREAAAAHDEHEQDEQERDGALDAREVADAEEVLRCRGGGATTAASPIPMMNPPSSVSGNDRKPPSSAAAIAVTVTMSVKVIVDRPVSGAMSTPAMPARPAPMPQVSAESLVGDHPMVCTARSFWAAALIASPTRCVPGERPEHRRDHAA